MAVVDGAAVAVLVVVAARWVHNDTRLVQSYTPSHSQALLRASCLNCSCSDA